MQYFNSVTTWIYRLMAAEFYFILQSLKGFIFLGIFPAWARLFDLALAWHQGEDPRIKDFFSEQSDSDKKEANILGYSLLGIGLVILFNLNYWRQVNTVAGIYLFYLFALLSVFWIVSTAVIFALGAQFKLPRWQYLRLALLFPIAKIIYALILGVLLYCYYYIFFVIALPLGILIGASSLTVLLSVVTCFSWRDEVDKLSLK